MIRLFVGGMNFQTDEEGLRRWFEQKGFTVVGRPQVVRDQVTGHHRGFGFVDLDDNAAISFNDDGEAIGLHQERIDGHKVTVRKAHPRKPREGMLPREWPRDRRPRNDRYDD